MTEINRQVVLGLMQQHYGVRAISADRVRRKADRQVWKITDSTGAAYALKYLQKSDRSRMIAAVNDYMHGKGIPVTPVVSTLQGDSSVPCEPGCFLLFSWLEGSHPDYAEPGMIEKMARLLAEFHAASDGYAADGCPVSDRRLDWKRIYKRKVKKMAYYGELAAMSDEPFAKAYLSHLPWLKSRVSWVLKQLPRTALPTLLEQCRQDPRLGHGDYSHHNLLLSRRNVLTVIDLDTVSMALPMRDISHLCTCMNHELGTWSGERFETAVRAYSQIRPLSAEEHDLLLIDQIFPHKVIRLSQKYFEHTGNPALLQELERCIATDTDKLSDLGMGPS